MIGPKIYLNLADAPTGYGGEAGNFTFWQYFVDDQFALKDDRGNGSGPPPPARLLMTGPLRPSARPWQTVPVERQLVSGVNTVLGGYSSTRILLSQSGPFMTRR